MSKRRNQIEENLKIIARDMGPRLIPFINPEDLFRESTPEQRLEGLDAQQRLEGLDAQQRLEGLTPAQQLQGLSPEDIRDALSDEDRQVLRQLLDDKDNGV